MRVTMLNTGSCKCISIVILSLLVFNTGFCQGDSDTVKYSYESPDSLLNNEFTATQIPICNYANKICGGSAISIAKASNNTLTKMLNYFYSQALGANAKRIYYGESFDIGFAAATMYKKKQYVLYNGKEITALKDKYNSSDHNWILFSIIAHEFGHHINFHLLNSDCPTKQGEQDSDDFMGFWLARMGASEKQAKLALENLASVNGDEVYDSKVLRIQQMMKGFARGKMPIINSPLFFHEKNTLHLLRRSNQKILKNMDYAILQESTPTDTLTISKNFEDLNWDKIKYSIQTVDSTYYFKADHPDIANPITLGIVIPSVIPFFTKMVRDQFYNFWFIDEKGYIYSGNDRTKSGFTLIGKL